MVSWSSLALNSWMYRKNPCRCSKTKIQKRRCFQKLRDIERDIWLFCRSLRSEFLPSLVLMKKIAASTCCMVRVRRSEYVFVYLRLFSCSRVRLWKWLLFLLTCCFRFLIWVSLSSIAISALLNLSSYSSSNLAEDSTSCNFCNKTITNICKQEVQRHCGVFIFSKSEAFGKEELLSVKYLLFDMNNLTICRIFEEFSCHFEELESNSRKTTIIVPFNITGKMPIKSLK